MRRSLYNRNQKNTGFGLFLGSWGHPREILHLACKSLIFGFQTIILHNRSKNQCTAAHHVIAGLQRDVQFLAGMSPGPLIVVMQKVIEKIQQKVVEEINGLNLSGFHINRVSRLTLELDNNVNTPGEENVSTNFGVDDGECFNDEQNILQVTLGKKRSRPNIGTLLNLTSNKEIQGEYRQLLLTVISLGRTTPEFMDIFKNPMEYMEGENPKRNLFYPGNNILFIGRRAWACIILDESRKLRSFYDGVIETTLFAIHAIISNVRAIRQYSMRLVEQGESELQTDRNDLSIEVNRANAFFRKAQRASPFEDISNVLGAYFTTHTGIAAIKRLKYLTDYDNLIENTRSIMEKQNREIQTLNMQLQVESFTQIVTQALGTNTAADEPEKPGDKTMESAPG